MATTAPHCWGPIALVSIHDGATYQDVAAITNSIDIDMGDKEWEFVPNLKGGRIGKQKPEEDTMITFEGYPVTIGAITGTSPGGMIGQFYGGTDATEPLSVTNVNTNTIDKFQIFIMWSDDTTVSAATASVASGSNAMRLRAIEARLVSCKPAFTDSELKFTYKFRVPAANKTGTATLTWESTDGTASMTSLGTV